MKRAIVLFGHGSRDPAWRRPMDAVAAAIAQRSSDVAATCAFLELSQPDLPTAVAELAARGTSRIAVLPLFLGVGAHARQDLPRLVEEARRRCPSVRIDVAAAAGEHPEVVDLLAELALRSVSKE